MKSDGKKTLNLTIKRTSIPKKLRSFQTINRKASLVQDEGNKQKRESKEQLFSELRSLKVIAQVTFYKKTTIKQTFLP